MSEPAPQPDAESPRLSVVVVTHDSAAEVSRSLPALAAELREGDELIVCDNASSDDTPARVRELAPAATVFEWGANLGFGGACNAGAVAATNELLLFLNPDAEVQPGFRDAIELPILEGRGWAAWQGLVTDEGGATVNSWGGEIHYTGIAWAGGAGRPIAEAPATPAEVSFPSGACLAVRREAWQEIAGFCEDFFLYQEDTDLGLRLWLGGRRVGLEPRARADHSYSFEKGPDKWRYLERNRWATIVRTYPRSLLLAVLPALAATNMALYVVAALGGWLPQKLRADLEALRWAPRLLRERSRIHDASAGIGPGARIGAARFGTLLTPELRSAYLGRASRSPLLARVLAAYWGIVRRLLGFAD